MLTAGWGDENDAGRGEWECGFARADGGLTKR